MKCRSLSDARIAAVAVGVVMALAVLLLPLLLAPSAAGQSDLRRDDLRRDDLRRPLVTVQLENGERVTLRDADFLRRGSGEGPRGSRPPGTPTGEVPGTAPGGYPGEGGGVAPRDPRQPTHNVAGGRLRPEVGIGIQERDLRFLRRIDILRVEGGVTYADFTYKNGEVRPNKPMMWNALSGWERPGEQGEFYFFEAEEIRYLEFPEY